MLLDERNKCIEIFLADQEKAARHEHKGQVPELHVHFNDDGTYSWREVFPNIMRPFKDIETIVPDTGDTQPEVAREFSFKTKREHDQYFAARAEIRTLVALCATNQQKMDEAYLACLQWIENREMPLTALEVETARDTHNTYVQPYIDTIQHSEHRIHQLEAIIEHLTRGQG